MNEEFDFKELFNMGGAIPVDFKSNFSDLCVTKTADALPEDKYYIINASAFERKIKEYGYDVKFTEKKLVIKEAVGIELIKRPNK